MEYQTSNTVISTYDGVAARTTTGNPSTGNQGTLVYLHRDHLNSVSLTTSATGAALEQQEFDTWGAVKSGGITSVSYSYTGQRRDASTGLLFYNARYYDPALARFTQADSIVPGSSEGSGGKAASLQLDDTASIRSLTVDFHEKAFLNALTQEYIYTVQNGFWFQLGSEVQQSSNTKQQWGPDNPQALNRYSYVINNSLRYIDSTGHFWKEWGRRIKRGFGRVWGLEGTIISIGGNIAGIVASGALFFAGGVAVAISLPAGFIPGLVLGAAGLAIGGRLTWDNAVSLGGNLKTLWSQLSTIGASLKGTIGEILELIFLKTATPVH